MEGQRTMVHTVVSLFTPPSSPHLSLVSRGPELDGVTDYEVVRPIKLHTLYRRHAESSRPETLKYGMRVGDKDIEMHLEKNRDLLTRDYSETRYLEDGTQVTSTPKDLDNCYYHGRIVNDSESLFSMSTCDGLRGYFKTSAQRYLIEPLSGDDAGDHAVLNYEDQSSTPMTCGVTNTTWDSNYPPTTSKSRSRAAGPSLFQQQKYVELYLAVDNRVYESMKRNLPDIRQRMFEIVNFVNAVYKPLNTFVALTGMEVWSNGDQISVTAPAGATLDAFSKWRNKDLVARKKHDNAHLISGIDFEGSTVGLAFVGTVCSAHSTGVVQNHNPRAIAVGATLAHEMGHNLGMNHDDSSSCTCTGNSCIMAAALSWDIPRSFSSCSSGNFETFLRTRNPDCLLDKPRFEALVTPPVCGNGFLENDEQCDCGSMEECTNQCCNATTCTLTQGSQCAAGECCESCKILPPSRECRRKQDDCDLAEYCSGTSPDCPEDVFSVNGVPCEGDRGYCLDGQCPRKEAQCVKMYGPSAEVARQYCYDQNTRGLYYAFCKRPSPDTYIPCQQQDVMCGKLFCANGNNDPNYGRMVKFSDCQATFYGDHNNDLGQVDTGSKCGDGMVCNQNECVDLHTAYRNTNCSARCQGHAVCNHKNQCQCEPGWVPPNCDQKDGDFNTLSNEAITAIAVTISLLVLAAVIVGAILLWKKRQSLGLPSVHTRKPHAVDNPGFFHTKATVPNTPKSKSQPPRPTRTPPPPPPPSSAKKPQAPAQNFMAARQALRPTPPQRV
ncbi:zinc metalloproteinase-disintegrin-like batroxstatin-1 isoform X1 [Osmerus eperlanus]|uniref:zinc metalloproteinase-disintegrin-like batroxstatin-1 isoform X1 n=1 Tax=Osmerus eperlanus TaxID=29151 RepID=UPI002E0DB736